MSKISIRNRKFVNISMPKFQLTQTENEINFTNLCNLI